MTEPTPSTTGRLDDVEQARWRERFVNQQPPLDPARVSELSAIFRTLCDGKPGDDDGAG